MSITTTANRTSATGTASTGQEIPFTFPITDTSDLTVIKRTTATGAQTTLTETTDYSVTIDGTSGGTVTLVAAAGTASTVHVIRATPRTQQLDLVQGGSFSAEEIETAFDKLTKEVQDLKNQLDRALTIPLTDDGTLTLTIPDSIDRAEKYLYFDASGNVSAASQAAAGTLTVSAYAETVIDDANAAAARATLGSTTVGDALFVAASAAAARTAAGVVIGTNVQAYDADLQTIAGLTKGAYYTMVCNSGGTAWTAATPAAFRLSLSLAATNEIVCWENAVLCSDGNVLTWVT